MQLDYPGATLAGLILASDKTQLSAQSGDQVAHCLYATFGNINKSCRAKTSNRAYIPIAYLPVTKFDKTDIPFARNAKELTELRSLLSRRLFHEAMRVVIDPMHDQAPIEMIDALGLI